MRKRRSPFMNRPWHLLVFLTVMGVFCVAALNMLPEKIRAVSPHGDITAQAAMPSSLYKLLTLSNNCLIEYGVYRQGQYYTVAHDFAGEWWNGETRLIKIEWQPNGRSFYVFYERNDTAGTSTDSGSIVREFELLEKPPYARILRTPDYPTLP